jgi:hypothetical protein
MIFLEYLRAKLCQGGNKSKGTFSANDLERILTGGADLNMLEELCGK